MFKIVVFSNLKLRFYNDISCSYLIIIYVPAASIVFPYFIE